MEPTVYSASGQLLSEFAAEKRREAGLTQAEVGAAIDEPQSLVSDVERGQRRLDVIEFAHWCRALGRDPVALYGEFLLRAGL